MKPGPTITSSFEEFTRLYQQNRARFIRVAVNYVRDGMVAEDIVSDSFLAYWENRAKLPANTNVAGYLMVTVKNRCLNWLKQQQVHARVEQDIYSLQQRVISSGIKSLELCNPNKLYDNEVESIIRHEFGKMPDLTRRVFIASREEDKTHKEIASAFNISARKVNYEIQKAVDIFKHALKDYFIVFLIIADLFR